MQSEDPAQEKTEQPTDKRKHDLAKEGVYPNYRELYQFLFLSVMMGLLWSQRTRLLVQIQEVFTVLARPHSDPCGFAAEFGLHAFVRILAVFLIVASLAPIAIRILVSRFQIPFALKWSWSRMDPLKGLARLFSVKTLFEALKATGKIVVFIPILGGLISLYVEDFLTLQHVAFPRMWSVSGMIFGRFLVWMIPFLLLVVLMDTPFQIQQYLSQSRMTKQELKEESRETDGKPEVRSQIRRIQQKLSQNKMLAAIKSADLVLTNPTHFAVALKYDQHTMRAPIVVAKGQDHLAHQIRWLAEQHHIQTLSAPPLARTLYRFCTVDQPIPSELYIAVAKVLGYLYQLNAYQQRQNRRVAPPVLPKDWSIPEHMQQ